MACRWTNGHKLPKRRILRWAIMLWHVAGLMGTNCQNAVSSGGQSCYGMSLDYWAQIAKTPYPQVGNHVMACRWTIGHKLPKRRILRCSIMLWHVAGLIVRTKSSDGSLHYLLTLTPFTACRPPNRQNRPA